MKEIKIVSINISEEKGTIKKPVKEAFFSFKGIVGDAHSGTWHRQVSMLAMESIKRFENVLGRKIEYGEFAENITTEGMEFDNCKPLDKFIGCNVEFVITQIGKSCHGDGCSIFKQVGKCVMPKEGIFLKVLKEGTINVGDSLIYQPKVFKCMVITLSDRAAAGEYEDKSGKLISMLLENYFEEKKQQYKISYNLIPDDSEKLKNLIEKAINENYDFIFTTGGTGISQRDITIETVRPILDKEIPGIMEYIRVKYGSQKTQALLSRGIAGICKNTFVFTLPGSAKACDEYMSEILPQLQHMIYMLYGIDIH